MKSGNKTGWLSAAQEGIMNRGIPVTAQVRAEPGQVRRSEWKRWMTEIGKQGQFLPCDPGRSKKRIWFCKYRLRAKSSSYFWEH